MMKKIALIVVLMSWATASVAYTSYTYTSGTGTSSDPYHWDDYKAPGDLYLVTKDNTTYTYKCNYDCGHGTVPEPETFFLMGIGLMGLYLARRNK